MHEGLESTVILKSVRNFVEQIIHSFEIIKILLLCDISLSILFCHTFETM